MTATTSRIFGTYRNATSVPALLALMLVTLAPLAANVARAENTWNVSLTEKELKLKNPVAANWEAWFEGDLGYQRMIERSQPFLELVNDSTSTSPITQFHITIGDNRFNFGSIEGSAPVKLGRTTPGFNIAGSTASGLGKELVVDIGNGGLLPGQMVRFQIKLAVDPSFAAQYAASFGASHPDYRTVLFDMNGVNVYDGTTDESSDDNAAASVVYTPGGESAEKLFQDEEVTVSQYFNNRLRGGCCCEKDPVLIFQPEGNLIPEPGSVCLAMLGLSAGLFVRRRSRS